MLLIQTGLLGVTDCGRHWISASSTTAFFPSILEAAMEEPNRQAEGFSYRSVERETCGETVSVVQRISSCLFISTVEYVCLCVQSINHGKWETFSNFIRYSNIQAKRQVSCRSNFWAMTWVLSQSLRPRLSLSLQFWTSDPRHGSWIVRQLYLHKYNPLYMSVDKSIDVKRIGHFRARNTFDTWGSKMDCVWIWTRKIGKFRIVWNIGPKINSKLLSNFP